MGKEKNSSNSYPEASYFFYSKKLHISEGSHLQKEVRFCWLYQFSVGNHLICINHDPAANSSAWRTDVACSY